MTTQYMPPDISPPDSRAAWLYESVNPDAELVRVEEPRGETRKFMPFVITRFYFQTYMELSDMADILNATEGMDWGYIQSYQGIGDEWGENRYVIHYWRFEDDVPFAVAANRLRVQAKTNDLEIRVSVWGFALPDRVEEISPADGIEVETFPKIRYRQLDFGAQRIAPTSPPGLIEL